MAKVGSFLSKARWTSTQPGVKLIATAFLLSVLHTGLIGQDCTTPDDVLYPYPYLDPPEEVTEISEPIVINIYLHLVRDDEGEGGVSQPQIEQIKESLSENFEPIGFFFNYCLVEFNCEECYDGWIELAAYFPTQSLDDGINVYLFPTSTTVTVRAEAIPSKNAAVRYSGPNSIYAHEVGHCLGLHHTFANSLCPSGLPEEYAWYYDNTELVYGDECDERGDYVCDTPPDPRLCIAFTTCSMFENPGDLDDSFHRVYIDPDNVLRRNIMSYYPCADRVFTPGQEMRMREMLAMAEELEGVISAFSHEEKVAGTVLWDEPRHFNHDVILESGAHLYIETTVSFTPGHGIIMEEQSILSLDGAVLTLSEELTSCPSTSGNQWKGIGMHLNPNPTMTGPILEINNSTISFADKAIYSIGRGNVWVVATSTDFINNRISIHYTNTTGGPSWFTLCSFVVDDEYKQASFFPQAVAIHSSQLFFRGCTFDFQLAEPAALTRQAIQSYNSQIWVTKWSTINSVFSNWSESIYASGNLGSKFTRVQFANFIGNHTGIRAFNFHRTLSLNNSFDMSNKGISSEAFGINSIGSRSAQFSHNIFTSEESDIYSTGLLHSATFAEPIVLRSNEFETLDVGVYAQNSGNGFNGSTFLCNVHSGNREYDFLVEGGGAGSHGSTFKTAGNKFSQTGSSSESDFKMLNVPHMIQYHWDSNEPDEEPIYKSFGLIAHEQNQPSGCGQTPFGLDPTIEVSLTPFASLQSTLEGILDDLSEDLVDAIDDGDTPGTISLIETYASGNPSHVTSQLASLGPWVSIDAMLVFMDHVQHFSESQVATVLAGSPYTLHDPSIYEYVYGTSSPLSSTARNYITAAVEAGDVRSELEAEIAYEKLRCANNMNGAVEFVLLQDSIDYELLRSTLAWRSDFQTEIAITESYLDEGDYSGALDHIDGIDGRVTLSTDESDDLDDYLLLTSMLINVYNDDRIENALTSEELDTLYFIIENEKGFSHQKTCAILAYFYDYDCVESIEERAIIFNEPVLSTGHAQEMAMEIIPNPSSGEVEVSVTIPFIQGSFQLIQLDGKILNEITVNSPDRRTTLRLGDNDPGLYILRYIHNNGHIISKKLVMM